MYNPKNSILSVYLTLCWHLFCRPFVHMHSHEEEYAVTETTEVNTIFHHTIKYHCLHILTDLFKESGSTSLHKYALTFIDTISPYCEISFSKSSSLVIFGKWPSHKVVLHTTTKNCFIVYATGPHKSIRQGCHTQIKIKLPVFSSFPCFSQPQNITFIPRTPPTEMIPLNY